MFFSLYILSILTTTTTTTKFTFFSLIVLLLKSIFNMQRYIRKFEEKTKILNDNNKRRLNLKFK
jgi:hypothetical protein